MPRHKGDREYSGVHWVNSQMGKGIKRLVREREQPFERTPTKRSGPSGSKGEARAVKGRKEGTEANRKQIRNAVGN